MRHEQSDLPAQQDTAGAGGGRLMTFKAPQPSSTLIKSLAPINRWLCLGGIPGLRALPGLRQIPGIRGLMNIPEIDFPKADENRLATALQPVNATFITPNHPEFFTDWMLDKEILSRLAPMAASWATHGVVNGMGAMAQTFWLKNNLIAQIPGAGGAAGKAHSIAWALKGRGVLLHPEGQVGWHGDLIAPLFSGAVEMAFDAARQARENRKVMVAPVVWKLAFKSDVTAALHRELNYVGKALRLPQPKAGANPADRLYDSYDALLARDEIDYGVHPTTAPFFQRQQKLLRLLFGQLREQLEKFDAPLPNNSNGHGAKSDEQGATNLKRASRLLRSIDKRSGDAKALRKLTNDITRLQRFHAAIYPDQTMTQEHIAESIKRIRNDYCSATTRDAINKFLPQPAGPRCAHIRVPDPLDITAMMAETSVEALVSDLQRRMQMALDAINFELAAAGRFITYPNPFVVGRRR